MKILMLGGEVPYPPHGGSRMRVFQFIRALSQRHDLTLLAYAYDDEREHINALRQWCHVETVHWREPRVLAQMRASSAFVSRIAFVRALLDREPFVAQYFRDARMMARLSALLHDKSFAVLHVEDSAMISVVPADVRVPIVLSLQNVEYWRATRTPARSIGDRLERDKLTRFEGRAFQRAAACCATSTLEAGQVSRLAPNARVQVVANGVDTCAFVPSGDKANEPTIVFTGTLSYAPNADGSVWFVRAVLPLIRNQVPDVHLQIVGREPPAQVRALADEHIQVTGDVPDVAPYLQRAWIAVVPICEGGGTRLKILEALASALPVVSTSIGAEGLHVKPDENILLADDAQSFAHQVIRVLRDVTLRAALGNAGRALVEREYDWRGITRTLEQVYGSVMRDTRTVMRDT